MSDLRIEAFIPSKISTADRSRHERAQETKKPRQRLVSFMCISFWYTMVAKHANCNTTAPHLVSRGAFWYRVGCILAQVGCIFRGRGASQNYLDYSAIWSDYYSKIRAWRFYG